MTYILTDQCTEMGVGVTETTNPSCNQDSYEHVGAASTKSWQRMGGWGTQWTRGGCQY